MSQILDFYRGGVDSEGRTLAAMWSWDDRELDDVHDFIQWMFPLRERSRFNPGAPVLSHEDVAAFRSDHVCEANLRRSVERFLAFLGLMRTLHGEVVASPSFDERVADVWGYPNHNWLRITRVLKCLRTLGLDAESRAMFDRLDAIYRSRTFPITAETFAFWQDAAAAK